MASCKQACLHVLPILEGDNGPSLPNTPIVIALILQDSLLFKKLFGHGKGLPLYITGHHP